MIGYDVVTSEDEKIGRVADDRGDYLIVEQGLLRKTRHALPKAFAHPVDAERLVRVTVGRDVLADSPTLDDDDAIDEDAVARHYGLESAATVEGERHGVEAPERVRAEIREGTRGDETPHLSDRPATAVDPFGQTATRAKPQP